MTSGAGTERSREADGALLALIRTVDSNSQARHDATSSAIENLNDVVGDLRQLAANIQHIFGPEGEFRAMREDIKNLKKTDEDVRRIFRWGRLAITPLLAGITWLTKYIWDHVIRVKS